MTLDEQYRAAATVRNLAAILDSAIGNRIAALTDGISFGNEARERAHAYLLQTSVEAEDQDVVRPQAFLDSVRTVMASHEQNALMRCMNSIGPAPGSIDVLAAIFVPLLSTVALAEIDTLPARLGERVRAVLDERLRDYKSLGISLPESGATPPDPVSLEGIVQAALERRTCPTGIRPTHGRS